MNDNQKTKTKTKAIIAVAALLAVVANIARGQSLHMIDSKKALVYGIIAITVVVIIVTIYTALFRSSSDNSLAIKSGIQPIANPNNPSIEQFKNQFCRP